MARDADTDGVGEDDFVRTRLSRPRSEREHPRRIDRALERAAEGGPDRDGRAPSVGVCALGDARRRLARLFGRGVLIVPVERLARGEREVHLVEIRRREPVVAALVQDEARVHDTVAPLDADDDLLRAVHLRHARRIHEAHRLDPRQPRLGEPVDELGTHRRLERLRLVLQPVAGADVADRDACHTIPCSRRAPSSSSGRPSRPP